jgi:sugar lactone lactonase YvrE
LHWLDDEAAEPGTHVMPSMPAGIVPTEDGRLVVCLDDGLHLHDPDTATTELLVAYPEGLGERANDACADLAGNLVTGTLNLVEAPGSAWWFSATEGWRLLDDDIANTNGPTAFDLDGSPTLVVGDTSKHYFAYPYDAAAGTVGERRVFGSVDGLEGGPDGATLDAEGGLWCALFGGGQLARYTAGGLDRTVALPVANPTDVTFGGPDLDRLYLVSVAADGEQDGALLRIDGLGRGREEPRFRTA